MIIQRTSLIYWFPQKPIKERCFYYDRVGISIGQLHAVLLVQELEPEDISGHIRQYIKYLRERGKYTVVNKEESKGKNHLESRNDFKKEVSMTTIANYIRNIKVFFNFLYQVEREIPKNPVENIENPKVERKVKKTLTPEEIKRGINQFERETFHGYRIYVIPIPRIFYWNVARRLLENARRHVRLALEYSREIHCPSVARSYKGK
ncbi:hypothetical protein ACFPVX_07070 [Cohnella faecalis]|uniref:Core-binding (CB) domain-containing protein n=1 Tax=Cohnella faecalis TaxID=2315694 RepID=A0A398CP63_9BACL|nr:hypothetical protein [Cohnella faecalis]RIE00714.1 hypothetical protein D3H35_26315 [Cohnella faecalis]